MSEGNNNKNNTNAVFNVTAEHPGEEVPGVTRLLNRKKLESLEKPAVSTAAPKIQKAARRKTVVATAANLKKLTLEELSASKDPLQRGLSSILQKNKVRAVFFSGAPLRSSATYEAGDLVGLWTSLSVSGDIFPDIWRKLLNTGSVFIGPGSPSENPSEKLFKSLLGLQATDSLTVIYHASSVLVVICNDPSVKDSKILSAFPFLKAGQNKKIAA
jgi:hypothetical protein